MYQSLTVCWDQQTASTGSNITPIQNIFFLSLYSKTKCQSPCKQTRYEVKEYRTMKIEYLPDPNVQNFLGEFNDTKASVIVINHQKSKTIQEHLEVIEYDGYKFISDAGEYKTFLKVYV